MWSWHCFWSGHVSRFEAPFLWAFSSFPNLPLHCFPIHIQFSLTPTLRTERTKVCSLSTFASVLWFLAAYFLGHLAHLTLPWSACAIPKTLNLFIAYSPQTTVNRAKLSLAPLPIFTQNLMFIRSSRFLSLIFPPTVYQGHVLLPLLLGNKWLIWSVAHINAIWNMSKHAWVHEFASLNTPAMRCDYSGN